MLRSLQIENYALIDSLKIEFEEKMTVITGETGAGKSIMMGAMSLILGNRADTSVLMDAHRKCFVEAVFDLRNMSLQDFFQQADLDYQDDTIIRREISENGKSRAFINDTPVTLSVLKNLTSQLIDIHSQHQNLLFQDADFRVAVLDEFAGIREEVAAYHSALAEYRTREKQLQDLKSEQQSRLEKKDFLEFVYHELESAHLLPDEQEDLEQQIEFLSHTETIKANLFQSYNCLSEQETNVLDQLRDVKGLCSAISNFHSQIKSISERLESAYIELKDITGEIASLNDHIDYDPEVLEVKKQRLDLLLFLQQKHHVSSVKDLIGKMEELSEELNSIVSDDERIEMLEKDCSQLKEQLFKKADAISRNRIKYAPDLEKQIVQKIQQLGIPDGQFVVRITPTKILQKNGTDQVSFLFSGNKGVGLAELEKVASGGEMSRLMLSVKSTISDRSLLPTIVFDEIDVGISGEVAGMVAIMMCQMAAQRQLLVITHLPQIAAKGSSHFHVYKESTSGKSHTHIRKLNHLERINEIAKMMSGENRSEAVLKAAQELLEQ